METQPEAHHRAGPVFHLPGRFKVEAPRTCSFLSLPGFQRADTVYRTPYLPLVTGISWLAFGAQTAKFDLKHLKLGRGGTGSNASAAPVFHSSCSKTDQSPCFSAFRKPFFVSLRGDLWAKLLSVWLHSLVCSLFNCKLLLNNCGPREKT